LKSMKVNFYIILGHHNHPIWISLNYCGQFWRPEDEDRIGLRNVVLLNRNRTVFYTKTGQWVMSRNIMILDLVFIKRVMCHTPGIQLFWVTSISFVMLPLWAPVVLRFRCFLDSKL
jgi:hypothetical protein